MHLHRASGLHEVFPLRPVHTMRLHLHLSENFNIVVNGLVQEFGGKDKRKTQMQMHSGNGPLASKFDWVKDPFQEILK